MTGDRRASERGTAVVVFTIKWLHDSVGSRVDQVGHRGGADRGEAVAGRPSGGRGSHRQRGRRHVGAVEFRGLAENERFAALEALTTTFSAASLTDADLFAADLDAGHLDRAVRARVPEQTADLAEDGTAFYELTSLERLTIHTARTFDSVLLRSRLPSVSVTIGVAATEYP